MNSTLFSIIEFQSEPLNFSQFPRLFISWAQDAGGFAGVALVLLIVSQFAARDSSRAIRFNGAMRLLTLLSFIGYGIYFILILAGGSFVPRATMILTQVDQNSFKYKYLAQEAIWSYRETVLMWSGLFAIVAFAMPFIMDALRMKWRRIFAIAKLSFIEAVRRRVLWIFLAFLLIFLFPAKWFFEIRPENELRTSVAVVQVMLKLLLIPIFLMLASFSIPNDVKNQTIHTIVTKPVERFEILLGRFIGYVGLMTFVLFSLTAISYLFISLSKIDPASEQESGKARLPKYGSLEFLSKKIEFRGLDVGREKMYRKFIAGGAESSQRGMYSFADIAGLQSQSEVPCEFSFDIFRLTKGEENKPIYVTFDFMSWRYDPTKEEAYKAAVREALGAYGQNSQPFEPGADTEAKVANVRKRWEKIGEVAKKFGRFEYKGYPVYNIRTYGIMIPPGLFENASEGVPEARKRNFADGSEKIEAPDRIRIFVKCDSVSQMLGIAKYDLYLLEAEGSYTLNYFKGAVGLWCVLVLIIGLAVVCSTYFAGVIALLIALVIFILGNFLDFLATLASGTNTGGGPLESLTKLATGKVAAATLDKTPLINILLQADEMYRWGVRRFFNVLPDVDRFAWSDYVSEGFSIRPEMMLMHMLVLLGYLLPWFLIGYYTLKTREVAA